MPNSQTSNVNSGKVSSKILVLFSLHSLIYMLNIAITVKLKSVLLIAYRRASTI